MPDGENGTGGTSGGAARTPYEQRLEADNFKLRDKLRQERADRKTEVEALQAKLPTDGAVVLTGDDAKAFTAFKALNVAPEKLKDRLARADAADAEQAESTRVKAIVDAAEPAGFNGRLLAKFAKTDAFTVALKEQTVDGKKVSVPVGQKLGADGKAEGDALPLEEFVKKHLPDVPFESLKLAPDAGKGGSTSQTRQSTPFPGQSNNGSAGGKKTVDELADAKRGSAEYRTL